MHITTHLLMANLFYQEITSQMEIELDYFNYIYGNIKPDVHPGTINWPHFSHASLKQLVDYCEMITIEPMSVKAFSKALGIVSHFICDYYCVYHTQPYRQKGIVKHTVYEHLLELTVIKKSMTGEIRATDLECCETIEDTINERLALYNSEKHSIEKDIQYAVNTTICVLRRLVELSQVAQRQIPDVDIAYDTLKVGAA